MSTYVFGAVILATVAVLIVAMWLRENHDAKMRAQRRSHRSPIKLGGVVAEVIEADDPEPLVEPDLCGIPHDAYPLIGSSNDDYAEFARRMSELTGTTSELEDTGQWPAFRDNEPEPVAVGGPQLAEDVTLSPANEAALARFQAAYGDTTELDRRGFEEGRDL